MTRFLSLVVMLVFLAGCGGSKKVNGTVTGKITYKGQPVNGPTLQLIQTSSKGEMFMIPVTPEGTFVVTDVPPGEYKVVIVPSTGTSVMHTPKNMDPAKAAELKDKIEAMRTITTIPIPDKYKQRLTSDLTLTVTQSPQTQDFELKD